MSVRERVTVDTFVLREAFAASGLTAAEVGERMGWLTRCHTGDGVRVRRAIGIRRYSPGYGYPTKFRERVGRDMGVDLIRAMGFDPVDFDL